MTQTASVEFSERTVSEPWRRPLLGGIALAVLVITVFWDFFYGQFQWAVREQADWGHTLAIPFITAYFIYLNRQKMLGVAPYRTTWIGLLPVLLGVAVYMLSVFGPQTLSHHNLRGAGVGMTLFGLALLFFGFKGMVWLWFPLLYLIVFGQTISDRLMTIITFQLQDIAARGSHVLFILIGMDVERSGNIISVFDKGEPKPLNIAEACSGMRMLMAFLALGVAMAYTGLARNWQRILLVMMAIPTAIFVNILRVVTLGVLSLFDAELAAGDFHTFVGLVWLIPAFLILLGLMWAVKKLVIEQDNRSDAQGGHGSPSSDTNPNDGRGARSESVGDV